MLACKGGHAALVSLLLPRFEHLNALNWSNKAGKTSLMFATNGAHADVAKLLLAHGADVNASSRQGWTALIYACVHGSLEEVELLLSHGADLRQQNGDGEDALMSAALEWRLDMVALLLARGAPVDAASLVGSSALFEACRQKNAAMALLLVRHGADPHRGGVGGRTPLQVLGATAAAENLLRESCWARRRSLLLLCLGSGQTGGPAIKVLGSPDVSRVLAAMV